jgi:hypothetical protein
VKETAMNNDLKLNDVDTLGALLAQIKDLTDQADAIKDGIKDSASAGGAKVVEGAIFKATYSETNRSTVDYKKILAALTVLLQEQNKEIDANKLVAGLVASNTNTSAVFSVKVTSR